ncbi:unnamed protein product [Calicophoron daubneyi]|uniref:Abasic site processing protein HMCES n=1 Tax=Calicophoron daubneyi TaxID=300641 RepID=A0AAV2TD44_CALDB
MCGRTACSLDPDTLCKKCRFRRSNSSRTINPKWNKSSGTQKYTPSYNLAPGSCSPILIYAENSEAVIQPMLWGLIPPFVRGDSPFKFSTSNARIESLLEKPTYGLSMRQGKRCVVLAQGFYEWKTEEGRKQPYYIYPSDPKKLLMMAGVFAYNKDKDIFSYSVITTDAKGIVSKLHHRMPVVLSTDSEIDTWLDAQTIDSTKAYKYLQQVAKNLKSAPLSAYPVSPRMNSTTYDEPDCITPLEKVEDRKPRSPSKAASLMTSFLKRSQEREPEVKPKKLPKEESCEWSLEATSSSIKKEPL